MPRNWSQVAVAVLITGALVGWTVADARADDRTVYTYDGTFEDAAFDLESAILNQGLNIDYVSHVGDMLSRTKADVGGTKDLFDNATVFVFCSAALSREVMEADPMNIAFCPYSMFVAQDADGGAVRIGYGNFPQGPMQTIQALLDDIARTAMGQ